MKYEENLPNFEKLGLNQDLLKVLAGKGFTEPTEIQEKAIPVALSGKDIIGGSATGSGKTLVFASVLVEKLKPDKKIQALILAPTRELVEQIADSVEEFSYKKNFKIVKIYGGVDMNAQIKKAHTADIIVATPGRLLDHLRRKTFNLDYVKYLILDEVDRMFDMGFHLDVESILRQCPEKRQTMFFSATITANIDYFSRKYTHHPVEISAASHVDPSKLKQVFYDVPYRMKFSLLVHLLKQEGSNLVMVFCGTRINADFVAQNLAAQGIDAKAIHGGLSQNKRINILKLFHGKGVAVLVCTDVAARGLDIKDVSHVYNYDLPSSSEDYVHRIGRTARAGEKGRAISLVADRDYNNFNNVSKDTSLNIEQQDLPKFEELQTTRAERESRGRFRGSGHDRVSGGTYRNSNRDKPSRGSGYSRSGRDRSTGRFSRGSSGGSSYSSGRRSAIPGGVSSRGFSSRDSSSRDRRSSGSRFGRDSRDSHSDRPRSSPRPVGRSPRLFRSGDSGRDGRDSGAYRNSNRPNRSSDRPQRSGSSRDSRSGGRPFRPGQRRDSRPPARRSSDRPHRRG